MYINNENYENKELQNIIKECLKNKNEIINNFDNDKKLLETV